MKLKAKFIFYVFLTIGMWLSAAQRQTPVTDWRKLFHGTYISSLPTDLYKELRKYITKENYEVILFWILQDVLIHSPEIKEFSQNATTITINKNNNLLALGNTDGFIEIYDPLQLKLVHSFKAHEHSISNLNFNSSGTQLVSNAQGIIKIWSVSDWNMLNEISVPQEIKQVYFLNNDQQIAYTSLTRHTNEVRIFHPVQPEKTITLMHPAPIRHISIHPTKNLLASTCQDNVIRIWDIQNRVVIREFLIPDSFALSFSNAGKYLASTTTQLHVWNWESSDLILKNKVGQNTIEKLQFDNYDKNIFCSDMRNLKLLSLQDGHIIFQLRARSMIKDFLISSDNTTLFVVRGHGRSAVSLSLMRMPMRTFLSSMTFEQETYLRAIYNQMAKNIPPQINEYIFTTLPEWLQEIVIRVVKQKKLVPTSIFLDALLKPSKLPTIQE